jgi:hypothetical protein
MRGVYLLGLSVKEETATKAQDKSNLSTSAVELALTAVTMAVMIDDWMQTIY